MEEREKSVERLKKFKKELGNMSKNIERRESEKREREMIGEEKEEEKMIELRKKENIGKMKDNGVGGWNIEERLKDGCGKKKIIMKVIEGINDVIKKKRRNMEMGKGKFKLRKMIIKELLNISEVGYEWEEIEDMEEEIELKKKGLEDKERIEWREEGEKRNEVKRRSGDERKLKKEGKRKLKGERDRSGRKGKKMEVGFKLIKKLIVIKKEMMIIIDNEKEEIIEIDGDEKKRVCEEENIES